MERICIQNLGLVITEDCNLDCRHCLRGKKCQKVMSKEVIEATLNQCAYIRNLCLCGGEPFMHLEPIIHIVDTILKNKIIVDQVSIITNGTVYKEGFITVLKKIKDKIRDGVFIGISYDKYHFEEIINRGLKEVYIENFKKYSSSPFAVGPKILDPKVKLFNEGNAKLLDSNLTVDLKPVDYAVTYIGYCNWKLDLNGYCYIGPLLAVSVDGNITECDASFENQKTTYNYGNVLRDSLAETIKAKAPISNPLIYRYKTKRIAYKYRHYNK